MRFSCFTTVSASLSTAFDTTLRSLKISSIFLSCSFLLNASSTILSTSFFVGNSATCSPSEMTAFNTVSMDAFFTLPIGVNHTRLGTACTIGVYVAQSEQFLPYGKVVRLSRISSVQLLHSLCRRSQVREGRMTSNEKCSLKLAKDG